MGIAAARKTYAKDDSVLLPDLSAHVVADGKRKRTTVFVGEDSGPRLGLRVAGKKGAVAMEIWYGIEPKSDNYISSAFTVPKCPGDDAADEDLLLSADDAAENSTGNHSVLTVQARKRILELYDECRPKLFHYLRSLRLGYDQVDEVIQETFMRLTMQLVKKNEIENVQGWIIRVAHNLAITLHKRERRSMLPDDSKILAIEDRPDLAVSPEEAYSSKEQFKHMNAVLSGIKPKHRQCFQMRAQGLRYKDIGQTLGMSEQRVAYLVKQVAAQLAEICG